ncbi:hypothetical protein R2R35_06055 [Anaerocolumna sp. AGMB13020]|uniref:hypothetical protein n=1 Tax=Anaerocolumna sp. AGMB13020 TaxID=3081750 RepID=UPI002955C45D|nr:hypothetical protein [Anaerocolumna sp. AGMB13020]WOO38062.1 hypothetical protein R2R35_06055 [Anaerocolumna sp. AGMB13020]
MLSKLYPVLWISIRIREEKNFSLSLPLSLFVIDELLDCVQDLVSIAVWFIPEKKFKLSRNDSINLPVQSFSPSAISEMLKGTRVLLKSFKTSESYDLVNVTTDNVRVLIKML